MSSVAVAFAYRSVIVADVSSSMALGSVAIASTLFVVANDFGFDLNFALDVRVPAVAFEPASVVTMHVLAFDSNSVVDVLAQFAIHCHVAGIVAFVPPILCCCAPLVRGKISDSCQSTWQPHCSTHFAAVDCAASAAMHARASYGSC